MRLIVDKKNLKSAENNINNSYIAILNLYNKLLEKYNNIPYYWQGDDASIFKDKVTSYIENEKNSLENIQNLSNVLNKIVTLTNNEEERFENEVRNGEYL